MKKKSSVVCSRWAENYMVLGKPVPGPMAFDHHPWSRTWCDNKSDWVGKKAAQIAMTNSCLARGIYTIDILRNDVLYILPKKTPDATDFSKSKFDALLENSQYIESLFSNIRNVGHKQAGSTNFYIRGSRSRSALKSISVGLIIYDEFDEMNQSNVELAKQRTAGYKKEDIQYIKISTPTVPDFGISKAFKDSNQQHYFFKCPSCSHYKQLIYPDCLVIPTKGGHEDPTSAYLRCPNCKNKLPDVEGSNARPKMSWLNERNCEWVPSVKSNSLDGYAISGWYSLVRPLSDMADMVIRARTDEFVDKELNNSVLGLEHVQEGARVSPEQVLACRGNYRNSLSPARSKLITMGVDVGHKLLYYHIDEWFIPPAGIGSNVNSNSSPRALAIGVCSDFNQLEQLINTFRVTHTCIDVDPARRDCLDLADRFPKRLNLIRFTKGLKRKDITPESEGDELILQVNRTVWLDVSQHRYANGPNIHNGGIILPMDLPTQYPKHISALIKEQKRDDEGNVKSRYISVSNDDHWAFARVYSEIALPLALSVSECKNVQAFL